MFATRTSDDELQKSGAIRAISRGIAVLQAINRGGALSMMEIAVNSEVPYPTACRIVRTLLDEGMIEREPNRKRYRAAAMVQTLSHGYQNEDRLVTVARPAILELTRQLTWPVSLCSRVGAQMMIRDSTHTSTSMTFNVYYPGYTLPILESAAGKVYLAFCPDDERDATLRGLMAMGEDRVQASRWEDLPKLFQKIRQTGIATHYRNKHTNNPGKTSSVAAPILYRGEIVGALSLIFFSSVMPIAEAVKIFASPLKQTATLIASALDS